MCRFVRSASADIGDRDAPFCAIAMPRRTHPVDDIVITGDPGATGRVARQLFLGVRRNPAIAPSDDDFVKLLGKCLRVVAEHQDEIEGDSWRLGLVVAGPHTGASELASLASFARAQESDKSFRDFVARKGATTGAVRRRLKLLDEASAKAIANGAIAPLEAIEGIVWRLLRGLRVLETRVEGDDAKDRTDAVARLRAATPSGEIHEAAALFASILELSGTFATKGGNVDRASLRRALSGIATLTRVPGFKQCWARLEACEGLVRANTRASLSETATSEMAPLTLPRSEQTQRLAAFLGEIGRRAGFCVVTGEPDVGKSALSLGVVDRLREDGLGVIVLSLRDVPRSPFQFDQFLGAPLAQVLAGDAMKEGSLIVLDGAEIVLEGGADLLRHFARAALACNFGLAAVTRDDARSASKDVLADAVSASEAPKGVAEIVVPPLAAEEIADIVTTFPSLVRVADEPRARWLLARPGLVDALLRSSALVGLPGGAVSEADVFNAVWTRVVRRGERNVPGEPSADAREKTLLALAMRHLDAAANDETDAAALPSLRSDGLLQPIGAAAAWRSGDAFANDLVRDFATARLLITRGRDRLLLKSGAPRWTVRAARLSCQAALIQAGPNTENTRQSLQAAFDRLAKEHGDRWGDLPWEALISLGSSATALAAATNALFANDGAELERVLRIVQQRFTNNGAPDVEAIEPLIDLLCATWSRLRSLSRDGRAAAQALVVTWLSALALRRKDDVTNATRCKVRERVVADASESLTEHVVRCLGLLGTDLNSPAEAILRRVATERPSQLDACLESSIAPMSLAVHRVDLLIALAEAYYIEPPSPERRWRGWGPGEDGIREHRVGSAFTTLAAWHYGPFWSLLCNSPRDALLFINRMLDHAAKFRVAPQSADPPALADAELMGLSVSLPSLGEKRFVGDGHVWRWYRGSGNGPYPCMSALLATERFIDQLLSAGVPISALTNILLADCHSLAMVGLLVGAFGRYIDRVADELDPWLAEPFIWNLEIERRTSEAGLFRAHGRDEDAAGSERRIYTPYDLVGELVRRALLNGDNARLEQFRAVGRSLIARGEQIAEEIRVREEAPHNASSQMVPKENATSPPPGSGSPIVLRAKNSARSIFERVRSRLRGQHELSEPKQPTSPSDLSEAQDEANEFLLTVRRWASFLDHANYRVVRTSDGSIGLQCQPPQEIEDKFAAQRADHRRGQEAMRLVNLYGAGNLADWGSTLSADIVVARDLARSPPEAGPLDPSEPPAAVASASLQCHAAGRATLPRETLAWAIEMLIGLARAPNQDDVAGSFSVAPWGPDRLAARGLPSALLIEGADVSAEQRDAVVDAIGRLARNNSDEVRRMLTVALRPVWGGKCVQLERSATCIHVALLGILRDAARHCRLGPVHRRTGNRPLNPLGPSIEAELPEYDARDLLLDRLTAPLAGVAACAASQCCAAEAATPLRDALFEAHRRVRLRYAEKNFRVDDDDDRAIASALLDADPATLLQYVRDFTKDAAGLGSLLRNLSCVATYDRDLRRRLRFVWPKVMDEALAALKRGDDFRRDGWMGMRALASLVPRPLPTGREQSVSAVEAVIGAAREGWPNVRDLADGIESWVAFAAGSADCIDALIGLLNTAPIEEQINDGLQWIAALVTPRASGVAGRTFLLVEWLEHVRASGQLSETQSRTRQLVIDALVSVAAKFEGTPSTKPEGRCGEVDQNGRLSSGGSSSARSTARR